MKQKPPPEPPDEEQMPFFTEEALLYDSHVHTTFCGHAKGPLEDYAMTAFMGNLRGLVFTCHAPMPEAKDTGVRMAEDKLIDYLYKLDRLREHWQGLVDIRRGLECDFHPHLSKNQAELLAAAPLDYVLGSIHPHLPLHQALSGLPARELASRYFELVAQAAESKLYDAIAHFDLVKSLHPAEWSVKAVIDDVRRCLDRVAAAGVAIEINTAGQYRPVGELNPGPAILAEMCQRQIPVVLGSDAHEPSRVGDLFVKAMRLLAEAGYTHVSHFIERERQEIDLGAARSSFSREPARDSQSRAR